MKINNFAILAATILLAAACNNGGQPKQKVDPEFKDLLPTKGQIDSVSYLVGISFGSTIKQYDMQDLNMNEVIKGLKAMAYAKGEFNDTNFVKQFRINPQDMGTIINEYLRKKNDFTSRSNLRKGERFLEENKAKEGVEVTESGLQYLILEPGSDVRATSPQDTVTVCYKGTLLDGTVFDETLGEDTATFRLDRVIKGWTEGMQLVGEGGKIRLFIPSDLAYGERGNQGIEPNSTLIFDVEIKEVHPYVEPVEEPAKKK